MPITIFKVGVIINYYFENLKNVTEIRKLQRIIYDVYFAS